MSADKPADGADRRRFPRVRLERDCLAGEAPGRFLDISLGGLRFYRATPCRPGERLSLTLNLPLGAGADAGAEPEQLALEVTARWCRPGGPPELPYEIGGELVTPAREGEQAWLSFLLGQPPAAGPADRAADELPFSLFRSLVEQAGDPILILRDLVILYANAAFVRLIGGADLPAGRSLADWLAPAEAARLRAHLAAPEARGRLIDLRLETGGALPLFLEGRFRPMSFRDRPAELGIFRDVTRRCLLEEKMIAGEKLRALGEMAGGVAHDFNNVLCGILGWAQLLQQRPPDPESLQEGLQIIERLAREGSETVRRVQQFSRQRRRAGFARVDLNQVCSFVLKTTRPRWAESARQGGREISIHLELGDGAAAEGNEAEIGEVLTNLIFNAVDAMPDGGNIRLRVGRRGDFAFVSVSDEGRGISPAVRGRVFDPFFTTKGPANSGLGLSVSYGIAARHGGRLELESEEGRGATFHLFLPAADDPLADSPPAEPRPKSP